MGKIGPFGKSRKVFWHIQKGLKGFLERKRTSFRTKTNKNKIKVQQRRPKTEERRAFENLSVHFGCAENPPSFPKRTECCK
jgi:hypothetical protein